MTEKLFSLYISEHGEELIVESGEHRRFPLLGLLGEFTRAFYPVICRCRAEDREPNETEVWEALGRFTVTVAGDSMSPEGGVIYEKPCRIYTPVSLLLFPPEEEEVKEIQEQDMVLFWIECLAVHGAVQMWLEPKLRFGGKHKYMRPKERYLDTTLQIPGNDMWTSSFMFIATTMFESGWLVFGEDEMNLLVGLLREEMFRFRTRQVGAEILVMEERKRKVLTNLYHADGLLPLVWTEILWAIENGHYAHFCEICGAAFRLTRPYDRKAYICPRKECQKARRVQNAGGEKAIREKNREAKRKSRERLKRGERLRKRGI